MREPTQGRSEHLDVNPEGLWQTYVASRKPETRERLILHYAPLVKKVVGRMGLRPDGPIEWDDLINYGVLGLMDAVERYEPERGITFETFATLRIRGAVLDALRQIDPLGRLARRRVRSAQEAIQRLTLELGRVPRDEEVAEAIGLTLDQYQQVLLDASFAIVSLDQPVRESGGDNQPLHLADVVEDPDAIDAMEQVEEEELRERLVQAIRSLPEREQILLSLYYFEGLTMREVAEVMDISQTRVCQLHARAIMNLKAMLVPHLAVESVEPPPGEDDEEVACPLPAQDFARGRVQAHIRNRWTELFTAHRNRRLDAHTSSSTDSP